MNHKFWCVLILFGCASGHICYAYGAGEFSRFSAAESGQSDDKNQAKKHSSKQSPKKKKGDSNSGGEKESADTNAGQSTKDDSSAKVEQPEEKEQSLKVTVLDADDKPVKNITVSITPQDDSPEIELKTDERGEALFTGLAASKIKVMVSASGMNTIGGFYELNKLDGKLNYRLDDH